MMLTVDQLMTANSTTTTRAAAAAAATVDMLSTAVRGDVTLSSLLHNRGLDTNPHDVNSHMSSTAAPPTASLYQPNDYDAEFQRMALAVAFGRGMQPIDLTPEAAAYANWTTPDIADYDLVRVPAIRHTIVAIYVIIIVVGSVGNGLVVTVAACSRTIRPLPTRISQSATNVFVLCLALSDLALCTFSLPIQLHYQLTDRWHFGSVLCRLVFAALAVPMYLSTVTILLIAVDRYLLVVRPFAARLTVRSAVCLVFVNVVVSAILGAPVVHNTSLHVVNDDPTVGLHRMQLCIESWSNSELRKVYSVGAFLVQFCLPLILTAVLYARIYARLRLRRGRRNQSTGSTLDRHHRGGGGSVSNSPRRHRGISKQLSDVGQVSDNDSGCDLQTRRLTVPPAPPSTLSATPATANLPSATSTASRRRRTTKTNRILAAIVINFVVCWLPWNVFGLMTELDHSLVKGRHFKLVDLALKGFAMGSACINPLLYCWLNETLRRDLGNVVIRLRLYPRRTLPAPLPRLTAPPAAAGNGGARSPGLFPFSGRGSPGGRTPNRTDLPKFDFQPPSGVDQAAGSGESGGNDSAPVGGARLTVPGDRGVAGRWRVTNEPWQAVSYFSSSTAGGSPPRTVSVAFERSSVAVGFQQDNDTDGQQKCQLSAAEASNAESTF